jgi:hypothetical protein
MVMVTDRSTTEDVRRRARLPRVAGERGTDVSTEDLRVAIQRYRVFDRPLAA